MKNKKRFIILSGAGILLIAIFVIFYTTIFGLNITSAKGSKYLYIPTGSSYEQVLDTLKSKFLIKNINIFNWLAKKKNYPDAIKPGRYLVGSNMSYNKLINLLRSGRQQPVKITFSNVRTLNDIAGKFGKQLEPDSTKIINFFTDESNYSHDGFRKESIISVFIPNTYELYWNTDVRSLYTRMLKEYKLFWNDMRLSKAKEKNLTPLEVSILASIVDDEALKRDEKSKIAAVYINRIKRGIPLQSDPTILFALNDFKITRVLKKYLLIDSPYNTYRHSGFPPGPIGCATIDGIDAVLDAESNDYLYFAAKADFSGYHNFSRTLSEHNKYALLYQRELNKRKIFR